MEQDKRTTEIIEVITEVLRQNFINVDLLDVEITDASPFDDEDDTFLVKVSFTGEPRDMGIFSKIVRQVQPKLHEIKEDRFPVFSFIKNPSGAQIAAN